MSKTSRKKLSENHLIKFWKLYKKEAKKLRTKEIET
jgi:hypothetical protein